VDPADSNVLYAAAGTKESAALFVSRDDGKSWQKQARLPDVPRHLWVDLHSAADGRTLFLASAHSIAVANASGVRSLPLPAAVSDISLGFGSGAQPTIYATSEHGVFISKDGGEKWSNSGCRARARKCARSRPACSIRRRHMFLTIIWRSMAKFGWAWPRP